MAKVTITLETDDPIHRKIICNIWDLLTAPNNNEFGFSNALFIDGDDIVAGVIFIIQELLNGLIRQPSSDTHRAFYEWRDGEVEITEPIHVAFLDDLVKTKMIYFGN